MRRKIDGWRHGVSREERLRVTEIFYSLQGESRTIGCPTVFVRLTGCPLRCRYCDTRYAFRDGHWMSLAEILAAVRSYRPSSGDTSPPVDKRRSERPAPLRGPRFVTVTGGEPLAQPSCHGLLGLLCDGGYRVSLETSGALDISGVDERVSIVMDIKTPGSGEVEGNRYGNLARLSHGDQIKFVICHRRDYEWARARLDEWDIAARCEVLFLPVRGQEDTMPGSAGRPAAETLPPATLADWILADRLPVRMQIQLHKYLWGDVAGK